MNNHVNDNRNYTDYPFVGVGVVAWRKDKFILIQRAKPPMSGEWSLPGGRQELGETTKEAAYREVMEEASIHIDIIGLVDVVDSIQKDEQGNIKIYVTAVPENGKANKAIINLIAKELKIAKSQLKLIRGETSKEKWFELNL